MKRRQTVFVGLSGGVDSSVAAYRLVQAGYAVVGVFIKVWHPDFLVCNWEQERLDAMRVAAHLGIPFLTCDAEEAYRREVGEYFVREYAAGRTPNPDVMCNQAVKFGAFLEFAHAHGADYIATGHYAQVRCQALNSCVLERGVDTGKDQSYFLWTLTQEQLARVLFPVGDTTKEHIRREATAAGLPVAAKKDSQGICFLGHVDIPEFLSHFVELSDGPVLDTAGNTIGTHHGAITYTLGQRHGFALTTSDPTRTPHYVVAKGIDANTITVAPEPPVLTKNDEVTLIHCNWIGSAPAAGQEYDVQFRYRQTPLRATITSYDEVNTTLALKQTAEQPAAGQSCVLYDGVTCLGGGIIA